MPKSSNGRNPIDVQVGQRLRIARSIAGVNQQTLGEAVSLSWQQIQKYEQGANRISASMLWGMSRFLCQTVAFFFEGIEEKEAEFDDALMRELLELARVWKRVPGDQRRTLLKHMRAIGSESRG
jgi:transcriptional regulator with XRE-family HTH domain